MAGHSCGGNSHLGRGPIDRDASAEGGLPHRNRVSFLNSFISNDQRTADVTAFIMSIPIPLQEALRDSITSGTFVDTKFWVFSKRRSSLGRVGGPKALFVNERVLRRVPRLHAILDGCGTKHLRALFPSDRTSYTDNYNYEDDSDLEEDEDDDISDNEFVVTRPKDDPELVTVESADAKGNDSSDVISPSDLNSLFSDSPDTKDERKCAASTHVGRVAIIEDVAFVTFQALLLYLYTNEIEFAPWGSAERRKARALEPIAETYGIPKPSPKSIYRLADKYEIPELKELALRKIQQDLSKCDIAEEVFSKFTSWYPELRELELRQLARTLLSSDPGLTLGSFKKKVENYTHGKLPHGKHIISVLYELMESDLSLEEAPLSAVASSEKPGAAGEWTGLKKALTNSLTSGSFLDSQFHAAKSKLSSGLPEIQPIYFCSTVSDDFMSKLMACTSKLKARTMSVRCANEYDSDLDDEEPIQAPSAGCYPRSKWVRESPSPPNLPADPALLLSCGAAKTWSAIFLYVYTGRIAFAPIASRNVPSKETQDTSEGEPKSSQDRGGPSVTPPGAITVEPCSPKSIYRLANKVGLTVLCDIAFKDIQSTLDEDCIITELFSPFTAEYKNVREMEHELFQSKLKPLVDSALIPYIIENSSSGDHPHRTATLELILERSILERRKRMLAKARKDTSQQDPPSQPKPSGTVSKAPVQQAQPPAHVPQPQPQPQPPSGFIAQYFARNVSVPTKVEVSPSSSTISKSVTKEEVTQHKEPPVDTPKPAPPEDVVELVCMGCGVRQRGSGLASGLHCASCPRSSSVMRCVGCGTVRTKRNGKICTNCHKKFN